MPRRPQRHPADRDRAHPTATRRVDADQHHVQQLTVEALLTGKREHVYHAAMLDPHTAAELDLDQIWQLVDDLSDAHGDDIPEWLRS